MRAVTKTMPAGCVMEPADLLGAFKEAGFIMLAEECPFRFAPPWFTVAHADGSITYVQLKDFESPVIGTPTGNLGPVNW